MNTINYLGYTFKPDWAGMWENGIKAAWSDDMVRRHGSINKTWDSYAKRYEEDEIKYSNRADLVDKIIASKPDTILDVGGGTGVFAIPLAKLVKRVVVVEPSGGMLDVLKKKAEKQGLNNIIYVRKKWEDVSEKELIALNDGVPYDVVLVSHSIYYITDLHKSFLKMNDVAKGYVYLFTGCSGFAQNKDFEKLHLILHKKPLTPYPDYSYLYMVVRELGIQPDIQVIDAKIKKPIKNIQELVDRWKVYLNTESLSEDQDAALKEYFSDKIKEENGQLFHSYEYKNGLVYWKISQDTKGAST